MATTPMNTPRQPQSEYEKDASGLKRTLKSEAGAASDAMHDARDAVTGKASQFASEAKRGALDSAEGAKRHASESLRTFAETIREAGDKLSDSDQGMAAGFVRQAASGLERLSTSLGEKRFGEMVDDVRNFGRTNPTAFIAGSVLAGLAIGRFVRSTASDDGNGQSRGVASQGGTGSQRGGMAPGGSRPPGASGSSFGAPIGGAVTKGAGGASTSSGSGSSGRGSRSSSASSSAGSFGSPGVVDQTGGISGGAGRGSGTTTGGTGRPK